MARVAEKNPLFWLTRCTRTKDEQDRENPYKPFPELEAWAHLLDILEYEPAPVFIEKSRTVMMSWFVTGWAAHRCFTRPATTVVFQSVDYDRALKNVEYAKELWRNSIPELQDRWKLFRPVEKQAEYMLSVANGSWMKAITGEPSKVRSEHPTIVILDEAAHMEQGEESFNVAMACKSPHVICLSSASPGWFRQATEFAKPVDWPKYIRTWDQP